MDFKEEIDFLNKEFDELPDEEKARFLCDLECQSEENFSNKCCENCPLSSGCIYEE